MTTLLPALRESFSASDAGSGDKYGFAVDSDSTGSVIAVSAPHWYDGSLFSGAVYIYDWNGTAHVERSKIQADIPIAWSAFGTSVALNSDGTLLAVGTDEDVSGNSEVGRVYIFFYNGSSWSQRDIIESPSLVAFRHFGSSVSFDASGDKLLIGARGWPVGGTNSRGSVFTYEYADSAWAQTSGRVDSTLSDYFFGKSVSLSSDGLVMASADSPLTGNKYGAVHIHDLVLDEWVLRYIVYNTSDRQADDGFGEGVGLNDDGSILYAGAPLYDVTQTRQGKIYKFLLGLSSETEIGSFIKDGTITANDYFGYGVATDDTGDFVLSGAYGKTSQTGLAQAFIFIYGSANTALPLDTVSVGEHDMVISYASNPVVLISATATGHAQNVGAGSALLLGISSASGYYPIDGDGSASLTLSAAGKGQLRSVITRQLNQESELSIGFLESIRHLNQERGLNAFIQKQRQLDQENKISIYQSAQRQLNQQGELNAYEQKYRVLNQQNALFVAKQYVRQLNQEMALSAYEQAQRKFNQESKLSAYQYKQRQLNQESSLSILVEVIRRLNQEGELNAYEPRVRQLNQESSTSIYKTVTRYLNGEYSLKVALQKIRQLNQSSELHAYEQRTRHLNQESSLLAYMPVVRFLDICYKLQADEKFFTFATNLETGATSEYTKYNFNSLSDGIGASSTGIYDLAGSTDNGANIEVLLELGKSDFGKIAFKRVTDSYLGVSSDGNLKLTVTTESGTESYTLSPSTSLETVKSNLARGHKGRWWSIKVENVDGSSIELESVEVLIQLLSRSR